MVVTCPLQNGVPSECADAVEAYYAWTSRPLNGPYVVTNQCTTLGARQTGQLRDRSSSVRPIGRFCSRFATVGYSMQTTILLGMTAPMKMIGRSWTSSISSMSFLLRLLTSLIAFAQVSDQRNVSTKKMTISGLLQTPQSIRRHLMAVSWGFCLIGPASLQPFIATPSSLAPIPSSLRLLSRPQRCSSTSSKWCSAIGMPQTTGMPMQQQMKKLPSALNVPHIRVSSNGSLRLLRHPY
jgi:hypothetical protein